MEPQEAERIARKHIAANPKRLDDAAVEMGLEIARAYNVELTRLHQELAEFDDKMGCGHERRFVISADEGTSHCAACSYEAQLAEARAMAKAENKTAKVHFEGMIEAGKVIKQLRDSLNWLVHLCHGCSKGGDEYSPPSDSEWKTCLKEAEELLQ